MQLKASRVALGIVAAALATGPSAAGALTPTVSGHESPLNKLADDVITSRSHVLPSRAVVGLVPSDPEPSIRIRAITTPVSEPDAAIRPVNSISDLVPTLTPSGLGIPEVVLAAYRNAELAMATTTPGCGITWNLLAGIGKIESSHASGGATDSEGTTFTSIFGPALDGSLPGNEVIMAGDTTYVRAMGPMQFLPSTWVHYAADGNADGRSDPNNVFDAALAAAQYLCSGGLDLRDPASEMRAVLRYNNSTAYASDVLSWSAAYRSGGTQPSHNDLPQQVSWSDPVVTVNMSPPTSEIPDQVSELAPTAELGLTPEVDPPMINIPGLPPIPCGIFCPPPIALAPQ